MVAFFDEPAERTTDLPQAWSETASLRATVLGAIASLRDHPVSAASRRLRALATLSGSLTDALSPADAADLVERKALSALGATSAVVVTLGRFPPPRSSDPSAPTLHVVHAIGLPPAVRAALDEMPLDAPVPFAQVACDGVPRFLSTESALRWFPVWGAGMIDAGARSASIVPVWANGALRGVLGLTWPVPRAFDEDERAFVLTLGVMCAQAIMQAHLRAAERAARESAERANRSKARVVATVSHELRTPMNAMLGYTQLVVDEIDGPVTRLQRDRLGRVSAAGQHVLELIDDLLEHARIDAGEESVRTDPAELVAVVEQSLVLVRPLAEQKGLRLRCEHRNAPIELCTDVRRVRQILVNVLANAVKFTDAGEILLALRVEGERAVVEVTDSGSGIAAEHAALVFEPFWQANPGAVLSVGGTGLGLSVARHLARMLGGDLWLERSTLDGGSTFVLSLPIRRLPPRA